MSSIDVETSDVIEQRELRGELRTGDGSNAGGKGCTSDGDDRGCGGGEGGVLNRIPRSQREHAGEWSLRILAAGASQGHGNRVGAAVVIECRVRAQGYLRPQLP